jgi:hypothetical protein
MKTPYEIGIDKIGSEARAAVALGYKTPWGLAKHKGRVPSEKVIDFCRAADWIVTPHSLRPDIYPNPTDGLPPDRIAAQTFERTLGDLAEILRADERAALAAALERGPQHLIREIESIELTLDVRAQLLAAAQAIGEPRDGG